MVKNRVVFRGSRFKALIAAVTKFPSIGSFSGSEMVTLEVGRRGVIASSFGVVLSVSWSPAIIEGEIPLIALDERVLFQFVAVCSDKRDVILEIVGPIIVLRNGKKTVTLPVANGTKRPEPKVLVDNKKLVVDPALAQALVYLSNVAQSDSTRPESCCVFLKNNRAVSFNQKAIAVFRGKVAGTPVAVPIPLAKEMVAGDVIYVSKTETTIKRARTTYTMPTLLKAQKSFPIDTVVGFETSKREAIAVCDGKRLGQALTEHFSILGALARTEILVRVTVEDGKLQFDATNAGAKYHTTIMAPETGGVGKVVTLPLDEVKQIIPFFELQKQVTLSIGKNGATLVDFKTGWCLFPKWVEK